MTYGLNRFYNSKKWPFKVWRSHIIWLVIMHILYIFIHKKMKISQFKWCRQKKNDRNMNFARVIIENAFGSLKNWWWILKNFNSRVKRAPTIVVACYVLHNYCEMWKIFEPGYVNDVARTGNLAGFKVDRLPTLRVGEHIKQARELMRWALFEQWLIEIHKGFDSVHYTLNMNWKLIYFIIIQWHCLKLIWLLLSKNMTSNATTCRRTQPCWICRLKNFIKRKKQ